MTTQYDIPIPELRHYPIEAKDKGYHLWQLELSKFKIQENVYDYADCRKWYDRLRAIIANQVPVYRSKITWRQASPGKRHKVRYVGDCGPEDVIYFGGKRDCDLLVSLIKQSQANYDRRLTAAVRQACSDCQDDCTESQQNS